MSLLNEICSFLEEKAKFEEVEKKFKAKKALFYAYVEKSVCTQKLGMRVEIPDERGEGDYILTRVQRIKVVWDTDKTEQALKAYDSELASQVVQKELVLMDKPGFIAYAKSLGAEVKKMLSFFVVNKKIDDKALNALCEQGLLPEHKLNGCYSVDAGDPYWRVTHKERIKKPAET